MQSIPYHFCLFSLPSHLSMYPTGHVPIHLRWFILLLFSFPPLFPLHMLKSATYQSIHPPSVHLSIHPSFCPSILSSIRLCSLEPLMSSVHPLTCPHTHYETLYQSFNPSTHFPLPLPLDPFVYSVHPRGPPVTPPSCIHAQPTIHTPSIFPALTGLVICASLLPPSPHISGVHPSNYPLDSSFSHLSLHCPPLPLSE